MFFLVSVRLILILVILSNISVLITVLFLLILLILVGAVLLFDSVVLLILMRSLRRIWSPHLQVFVTHCSFCDFCSNFVSVAFSSVLGAILFFVFRRSICFRRFFCCFTFGSCYFFRFRFRE